MMNFESIDRTNEPGAASGPDEFEKLEFLPEESAVSSPVMDDTAQIIFAPEEVGVDEPPVSFSPDTDDDNGFTFDPAPESDLGAPLPFELFGSSLFDDPELDDDLDPLVHDDFDDDLEF
jgi:hypothetical protein